MKQRERVLFSLILAAYLVLGIVYSLTTPLFEASDELWHFPMVSRLADHDLALPVQDASAPGLWRQEGSQPPLYYWLTAILVSGIDRSDLTNVRRINPHADIGLVRPDGNLNMMVHRSAEAFPYQRTALAVHVARLFSVLLGAGTVVYTYLLGRRLFPEQPDWALGAMAINAFLPMFLFISGSVNNDPLSTLLGSALTLSLVTLVQSTRRPRLGAYALTGVLCGAGLLAKLSLGFFIPLIALSLLALSLRYRSPRPFLLGGLISGGLTVIIAGGWYWRNLQLYGDPTGLNVFLNLVGKRAVPANVAQLWAERHSFTQAYWGFFGGVNLPLPETLYLVLNLFGGLALFSAGIFLLTTARRRQWPARQWLAALITLLWIAISFASYLQWTAITPASQGRLIFAALSSLSVWMIVGLAWWLPMRWQTPAIATVAVAFAALAIFVPFGVIAPAYAAPAFITRAPVSAVFQAPDGGALGLQTGSTRIETPQVQPGDYVRFSINWQVEAATERNWSLFAHLVTPDGVIIAQRDVYPAGGRLATSNLASGTAWENAVAIPIPEAAYAPMTLQIEIGWYHLETGERMTLADGRETVALGTVELQPRPGEQPNAITIPFEDQIALAGYTLSDLSPIAGDSISLTLFWRGLRALDRDYVVFAHILDPATQSVYARSDAMPAAWTAPTTTWTPGQIVEDTHTLTLAPDTPPGIYELEIGLYQQLEDSLPRLRVVTPDGGMANDYVYLTRVRVLPAEASQAPDAAEMETAP